MRTSRHNIILMFLLLLVAGRICPKKSYERIFLINLENLSCGPFIPKYKSRKSNLDKVVKRRTYKQTPLGLEDPCVAYGIVS